MFSFKRKPALILSTLLTVTAPFLALAQSQAPALPGLPASSTVPQKSFILPGQQQDAQGVDISGGSQQNLKAVLDSFQVGPGGTGGGDSLLCDFGNGPQYYSYDFLMSGAKESKKLNPEYLAAKDAKDILVSMAKNMDGKLPAMAASLRDFIKGLDNTNLFDAKATRVWSEGQNALTHLPDESHLREIPKECKDSSGQANIFQTVVRVKNVRIEYNFDSNLVQGLANNQAIQLSFLYVHEWLRDYTTYAELISKVTRMLHETDWLNASGEQVRAVFSRTGLSAVMQIETSSEKKNREAKEKADNQLFAKLTSIQAAGDKELEAFNVKMRGVLKNCAGHEDQTKFDLMNIEYECEKSAGVYLEKLEAVHHDNLSSIFQNNGAWYHLTRYYCDEYAKNVRDDISHGACR